MNLHSIVAGAIGAVNPPTIGTVQVCLGYTELPGGKQATSYSEERGVSLQVQALSSGMLRHMDSLNQQGIFRQVYLNGNIDGLDRKAGTGGDLFKFNGNKWKVIDVVEPWDSNGWTKVIVAKQIDS